MNANSFTLRKLRHTIACTVVATLSQLALADDLVQVFDLALKNDPDIRQARANFNATHTQVDQGKAALLPAVSASAKTSRDTNGTDGVATTTSVFRANEHSFANGYNSKGYGLSLRQAVVNFEAWYAYQSVLKSDQVAALNLAKQEQQLIMRVATAYVDVLRSQANLNSYVAEEDASKQVLNQTQQRYDVGLIPITDVYESQANADQSSVNRLVEENNLSQRLKALEAITGQAHASIANLQQNFPIEKADMPLDSWLELAGDNNLSIKAAALDVDAKQESAKSVKASMLPTIDLGMSYNWNKSGNPLSFTGANLPSENSAVTLNFSVPLYAGGATRARLRQAYYAHDASEAALQKAQRSSELEVQNAYKSVETDVRAIAARNQAIISAQSALEANQAGAEVGTRNVIDVVLAQRSLFQAQRDYANARLTYVMDGLNLKLAAGKLNPQDVIDLNQWLRKSN
jgi:outer membrane protein